jgi:membrane protease YdiL (CAAX protease family)
LLQADVIGLVVLAVQLVLIVRWLAADDGFRLGVGVMAYLALAVCALSMWHGEKTAQQLSNSTEWAAAIAVSVLLGAIFFAVDMVVGSTNNPGVSAVEAGTRAGSPFGFVLTILICPGFTMVAVAGFIRSFVWRTNKADT